MTTFIAGETPQYLRPRARPRARPRVCPRARLRVCLGFAVAVASVCVPVLSAQTATAADEQPPTAFTPADISIGEPIALPVAPPTQPAAQSAVPEPAARNPTAAVPGSGWLGVTVAESAVPGRWRIDEVVAGGPAARAGIAIGDELRAVNGIRLQSLEEASQAVTSIAAGQEV